MHNTTKKTAKLSHYSTGGRYWQAATVAVGST